MRLQSYVCSERASAMFTRSGGDRSIRDPRHRDVISHTRTLAAQKPDATGATSQPWSRGFLCRGLAGAAAGAELAQWVLLRHPYAGAKSSIVGIPALALHMGVGKTPFCSRWHEMRACKDNVCGESKGQNSHDSLLDITFLIAATAPEAPIY